MFKLTTNDIDEQTPEVEQSLDELAREGARRMIVAALELEVEQYVQALRHVRDEQERAMVVRNGKSHQVCYTSREQCRIMGARWGKASRAMPKKARL